MKQIKFLLILFITCLLIANVSASVDILKPAQFNSSYTIIQSCSSCSYVNLTISNVNGIIISNDNMSDNGSGVWTYDITPTIISRHDVTGQGDVNGVDTSFATFFEVTPSGKIATTGDSILYALFSIILFGGIILISILIFTMPSKNSKGEDGFENGILKIKYLRIIFIFLLYPLTILLLNFLSGLAVNFSALSMFEGILGFWFEMMLRLSWPFSILMIAWIVYMLVHDTNLDKQLKKLDNIRF